MYDKRRAIISYVRWSWKILSAHGVRIEQASLTMELRNRGSWTGVIVRTKTNASIRGCTVRCSAFIASQFCSCWLTGRQIEEISRMGRVIEVTVEPPLVEGIIGEGRHRSIVVWEGLKRDVESPHRRCPYCYSRDTEGERPFIR